MVLRGLVDTLGEEQCAGRHSGERPSGEVWTRMRGKCVDHSWKPLEGAHKARAGRWVPIRESADITESQGILPTLLPRVTLNICLLSFWRAAKCVCVSPQKDSIL